MTADIDKFLKSLLVIIIKMTLQADCNLDFHLI